MAERLVSVDRETPMLLPPNLRVWVPGDDVVHFVIEAAVNVEVQPSRQRQRAVPATDDAGLADLLRRQRNFLPPPD